MNNARSFRTAVAERVHVSHHVVPQALLFLSCHLEVNVVQVRLHLLHLVWRLGPAWYPSLISFPRRACAPLFSLAPTALPHACLPSGSLSSGIISVYRCLKSSYRPV